MNKNEYVIGTALVLVAVLAPLSPWALLSLLDNLLVRVVLLVGLVAAVYHGYATGLLALVVIGLLYMERNRRKVNQARQRFDNLTAEDLKKPQATVEEEAIPQDTVPVVEFDTPQDVEFGYLPQKKMGSDAFERVPFSENLDQKSPLPTVPIGAKSADIFNKFTGAGLNPPPRL
jgi:hypothetical protein